MASLPDYVAAARPVPQENRAAWYKNTAQTYAGIMLWFVFWQDVVSGSPTPGGTLASGLGIALMGLLLAALFCHFLTYLVPGLLGMKTGLPLYVVGTSSYGVRGGFIMPGFLMGALQFGWLAVNAFFSCWAICKCFDIGTDDFGGVIVPGPVHGIMTITFILLAVGVGLKGIQYVARVATFMPLIPLAILILLLVKTAGGIGGFGDVDWKATAQQAVAAKTKALEDAEAKAQSATGELEKAKAKKDLEAAQQKLKNAEGVRESSPMDALTTLLFLSMYVVGFFATAGAAGVDFGMNNRDGKDVQLGGLVGIVGATFFAGGVAILVVAGAYGGGMVSEANMGELNPVRLMGDPNILGEQTANWLLLLLAIASFAPACFPAFIAANSFRTTMPNISPWITVGTGTLVSVALAVSGVAGQAVDVFKVVGASFGPICGAMMADYLLAGRKWAGPRAGFNLAGWISWAVGFVVGAIDLVADKVPGMSACALNIPCPPMAALIVGFVLYLLLAMIGLQGKTLEMPKSGR